MNYRNNKGWSMPFVVSAIFHVAVVFILGLIIHYSPPAEPAEKKPTMVEIYDPGGGGGEPAPEEAVAQDNPPEQQEEVTEDETVPEEVQPQIPPIPDPTVQKEAPKPKPHAKPRAAVKRTTKPGGRGTGGSGTGSGGGQGSGHGTGTGSGTGSGSGDSSNPQLLSAPKPNYPSSARKAGVEGTVLVGLTIGVDGRVASAWVLQSSGSAALDQAAVGAVQRWKFVPAKKNGQAVAVETKVPVTFNLRDA